MPNKLQSEQSQYLLQHAHNPVDWYPWCDEAFIKAKEENKPVIVSIGYAACHWCHVMERESFENDEIAAFMNEHFVCIKVDREENPDVDLIYMDAVTAISGSGGWPLNVFVTPDRLPFYGGTYYPPRPAYNRPSWSQLLYRMAEIWYEQPTEVTRQATQMVEHLKQTARQVFSNNIIDCTLENCRQIAADLLKRADKEKGGFGNSPKFPGTMAISYLLEHYKFTNYQPALHHALLSLDGMANGGIYDQLGGGFARYSTDRNWLAPHFEKMLYDNALLISTYCDAYSITKNNYYKIIIENTIAFVERELKDPDGGYYCAIDADSEGVEGKYYTWQWDEFKDILVDNLMILADYFGVCEHGNWEETNILHVSMPVEQIAIKYNLPVDKIIEQIKNATQKLLEVREKRIRPLTDDKCLLSWNALMNMALSKAGMVLDNEFYLSRANKHAQWMLNSFLKEDTLYHVYKNGVSRIPAKLDDFAYLIQALIQVASATGDNSLLPIAAQLINRVKNDFSDENDVFFLFTSALQNDIPVRKAEIFDGTTPSANAIMANNLLLCGILFENIDWIEQGEAMLRKIVDNTIKYSYSFGYWAQIIQRKTIGLKTVICAGKKANGFRAEMMKNFLPQTIILTLEKEIFEIPILKNKYFEDKNHIFVCSEQNCFLPVNSVGKALQLILG